MATTAHEPPRIEKGGGAPPQDRQPGNGRRGIVPAEGDLRWVEQYSPPPASTGIWVVLAAITMTFAAFTSALIVRQGASLDWRHFRLPSILYVNTLLLLISSVTLEISRRRVAVFLGGPRREGESGAGWLYVTLSLGVLFLAGQYAAWLQLKSQGFYLATNPSSSFFYVLTAAHGLHVLGGLAGLVHVIRKLNRLSLRRSTLDATARYWHFMAVLWIYLLLLLWIKV
jgi:cytochrome c oxidase subunit III